VRQTVTLKEIPEGSRSVRLWIAIPGDAHAQKLLDLKVSSAPGPWRIERESEHGNRFIYVEVEEPGTKELSVVVDFSVRREPIRERIDPASSGPLTDAHRSLFAEFLRTDTPLMEVDAKIRTIADRACGSERNVVLQARRLFDYVADYADHYSKDPTKPKCGRGAAVDCLEQKGGCCTDLHSLFIALARARGIPARLQFGLRLQPQNEAKQVDPGYRCWVEYFVPGYGWVPTDVVAGDSGALAERDAYVSGLDDRRLWYCEGRDFELSPRQTGGRVNTMIVGHAEIDGTWVSVLPGTDGSPSPLARTLEFVERRAELSSATQPRT
jgi:transglutaminase-like putative cysteine protease